MIYTFIELQNLDFKETLTALSRYLYKFYNHRKEIKKLKAHEKHFLFKNMYILRNDDSTKSFDLKEINEASEYYFNNLIMIYSENLNFDKPTKNYFNQIINKQVMESDKGYFDNFYSLWVQQLNLRKGKYLNIIHTELNIKFKELSLRYEQGEINKTNYDYNVKYLYTIGFYIYYKVKLFFDGQKDKFVLLDILGENIIINIYSFVHILFRHYFPYLDNGSFDRSINTPLPFFDIENLPYSAKNILIEYFNCNKSPLIPSREYLLLSFKNDKYIIWLKYCKLEELNYKYGFEFRTLYKCKEKRDLDKFDGLTGHQFDSDLFFYF